MFGLRGIWTHISTHPLWSAVIAGIIVLILTPVISGLSGWWRINKPAQKSVQQSIPALKSLETYCKRLKDLDDRFLERAEFIEYMVGKEVEWVGLVQHVTPYSKA